MEWMKVSFLISLQLYLPKSTGHSTVPATVADLPSHRFASIKDGDQAQTDSESYFL
jgi:hypothetical protein